MKYIVMNSADRNKKDFVYEYSEQDVLKDAMTTSEFDCLCNATIQEMLAREIETSDIIWGWYNLNIDESLKDYYIAAFRLFIILEYVLKRYVEKVKETNGNGETSDLEVIASGVDVRHIKDLNELSKRTLRLTQKMNFCLREMNEGHEVQEINEVLMERKELAVLCFANIYELYLYYPELNNEVKIDGLYTVLTSLSMAA